MAIEKYAKEFFMSQIFRVLVVDDSIMSRTRLKKPLTDAGFIVCCVESGEEALDFLKNSKPDIILLDMIMPGISGLEVLAKIKENDNLKNIPVIFLTGEDSKEPKLKTFELGAVDYITKPFLKEEVIARVKIHLKNSYQNKLIIDNLTSRLKQVETAQSFIFFDPQKTVPEAKCSVFHKSLLEAGGDFFDVIKINENVFSYFVGDVSGHDISVSYINPALKALLQSTSNTLYKPIETVKNINEVLANLIPKDKYVTAVYLWLDRQNNKLTYLNCGHLPLIKVDGKTGDVEIFESNNLVLGFLPNFDFKEDIIPVKKGDKIILFTDGLLEFGGNNSDIWTKKIGELENILKNLKENDYRKIPELLLKKCIPVDTEIDDDIIVMALEV